jgi:hypothetical protein
MATTLADAFRRAGLPAAQVAFGAACHDLARMALNESDGNPRRAIGRWLDLARQPLFRDGPLAEYLAAAAADIPIRAASKGHPEVETQAMSVPAPREPHSDAEPAQGRAETHARDGDLASEPLSDAGNARRDPETNVTGGEPASEAPSAAPKDHGDSETHNGDVPALREPSAADRKAKRKVEKEIARITSGHYIYDTRGHRNLVDDLSVSRMERLLRSQAKLFVRDFVSYNALTILLERAKKQAYLPPGSVVSNIFSVDEINDAFRDAYITTRGRFVMIPEAIAHSNAETIGPSP